MPADTLVFFALCVIALVCLGEMAKISYHHHHLDLSLLTRQPLGLRATRQPLGGGGIKLPCDDIVTTRRDREAKLCTHLPEYMAEGVSKFGVDPN